MNIISEVTCVAVEGASLTVAKFCVGTCTFW